MRLARKRLPSSVSSAMNSKPPAMAGKFGRFWAGQVLACCPAHVLPINLHALTKCCKVLWASFEHIRIIAERFRKQSWLSFLNRRWHIAAPRPSSSSSIVFAVGVPTGRKRSSHPAGVGFCSMGVFIPKRNDPSMKVDDHCCTKRASQRPGPKHHALENWLSFQSQMSQHAKMKPLETREHLICFWIQYPTGCSSLTIIVYHSVAEEFQNHIWPQLRSFHSHFHCLSVLKKNCPKKISIKRQTHYKQKCKIQLQ